MYKEIWLREYKGTREQEYKSTRVQCLGHGKLYLLYPDWSASQQGQKLQPPGLRHQASPVWCRKQSVLSSGHSACFWRLPALREPHRARPLPPKCGGGARISVRVGARVGAAGAVDAAGADDDASDDDAPVTNCGGVRCKYVCTLGSCLV